MAETGRRVRRQKQTTSPDHDCEIGASSNKREAASNFGPSRGGGAMRKARLADEQMVVSRARPMATAYQPPPRRADDLHLAQAFYIRATAIVASASFSGAAATA